MDSSGWNQTTALVHLFAALGMIGVIWTVQVVIYPLFSKIGSEMFQEYHVRYMKRITWIVGPLMLIELISAFALCYLFRPTELRILLVVNAALVIAVWLVTALVQVPTHNALSREFSVEEVDSLVRGNWVRTVLWTVRLPLLAWIALRLFQRG